MALKKVHEVKVGSNIRVKGVDYKVKRNGITDLTLNEILLTGFATNTVDVSLRRLIGVSNPNTYVEVVSEPKADLTSELRGQLNTTPSSLTEQLRKQKSQQDLTESLRSQVEEDCSCEDCEDYDSDDEGDDDEEDDDDDKSIIAVAQPLSFPSVTTANLRSQAAQQAANQARLEATIAKAKATGAIESVNYLAEEVEIVSERLDVHEEAHNALADVVERQAFEQAISSDSLASAFRGVSGRVSAIESKIKEEERKVNLQAELNRKLAAKKAQSDLQAQLDQKLNKKTTGGSGMKNILGAFKAQFGKVEGKFAFSPVTNGLALRKGISTDFVAYDAKAKTLTDVSGLTLKFDVPAFKLPTAEKDVKVGDIIIHNAEYVYVTKKADGYLETINPEKAVRGSVIPTKNALLGAAFYTVVKTLDAAGEGGFNPMLLMAMGNGSKDELLPLLLMSGGLGGAAKQGQIDPTMLMLLGDSVDELLPLVLMQQGGVAGQGFNPLMFLAMNKGGNFSELLPLLAMTGGLGQAGGQAGAINPMMLLAMGDGGSDMKDLLLMQALTGQNIFGGVAPQAPAADAPNTQE